MRRYYYIYIYTHDNYRGRCYPVCGIVHIKESLLFIEKRSPCSGGSGFFFSLSSDLQFAVCNILDYFIRFMETPSKYAYTNNNIKTITYN